MVYSVRTTKRFDKSVERMRRRGYDMGKLRKVIELLMESGSFHFLHLITEKAILSNPSMRSILGTLKHYNARSERTHMEQQWQENPSFFDFLG